MYVLDVIFLDKKLHVSAGSGHHQVLSFDSLNNSQNDLK